MSSTVVTSGQTLEVAGIIPFDTIEVQSAQPTSLVVVADATLASGSTIVLDGNDSFIDSAASGGPFELVVADGTIEGAGAIQSVQLGQLALINEVGGVIDADGTAALSLLLGSSGPAIQNGGLIEAMSTGGLLITNETIDNFIGSQPGTIAAAGNGAIVTIQAADIAGGTLASSGGGTIFLSYSGADTFDGTVVPVSIAAGSTVTESGGLTLEGSIANSGTIVELSNISVVGAVTLSGGGVVLSESAIGGNAATLVNVDNTIEGAGNIGISLGAPELINESGGSVVADATGELTIGSSTIENAGLIEAVGSSELAINSALVLNYLNPGLPGGTIAAIGSQATVVIENAVDGGTLQDSAGGTIEFFLNGGTLDGLNAPVTIAAGSTVTVNGQLALEGTIVNSGTLLLPASALFNFGSVALSGGGVIALGDSPIYGGFGGVGTLDNIDNTIAGAEDIGGFSLALINGVAGTIDADSNTISLGISGGTLGVANAGLMESTGSGGLSFSTTLTNTGTVLAAVGDSVSFDNSSPIDGAGSLIVDAGANMALGSSVGSGQTIVFNGSAAVLTVSQALEMQGTIESFATGDTIYLPDVGAYYSNEFIAYDLNMLTIAENGVTLATFDIPGSYVADDFVLSSATGNQGGSDLTIACYALGTRILTARGEVAVEELTVGEMMVTASGTTRPIRWIGQRGYSGRFIAGRHDILPIRIGAGALGDGVPKRDLLVSPNHALFLDGVLIPAGALVNGLTIAQVEEVSAITYFHIELDSHDILLADGALAESYLDTGNRLVFANGGELIRTHPDLASRCWDDACAELVEDGPRLVAAKSALFRRACIAEAKPGLSLMAMAGQRDLSPEILGHGVWRYHMPRGSRSLKLLSPHWVPAHFLADSLDRRRLGVRIFAAEVDSVALDFGSSAFASGFHAPEDTAEGECRWTDGHAELTLPGHATTVVLRVGDDAMPVRREGVFSLENRTQTTSRLK